MTTNKKTDKRSREVLRRLGHPDPSPPKRPRCAGHPFRWLWETCDRPGFRERVDHQGVARWYCAEHDPNRIIESEKNKKQRKEDKKNRWKQMERDRRG